MRDLIDFLRRRIHWLVFLLIEAASLVSLFRHNSYQGSAAFTTANTVAGTCYRACSAVTAYLSLADENRVLEQRNEQLRLSNTGLRRALRAMQADTASYVTARRDTLRSDFAATAPYHLIPAQVIRATLHRRDNLLTIDRGTADGVRPEMGVVSSAGAVGIVYLATAHYAVVIPLLNSHSQISCRLAGSHYFGVLQWQQGDPATATVNGIPRHAPVHRGDIIETNGYSAIFPEGIPLGRVKRKSDSADGMSYRLTIRLSTDFGCLRNVAVIAGYQQPERRQLEDRADSLNALDGE